MTSDDYEVSDGERIPMRTWMIPFTSKELSCLCMAATTGILVMAQKPSDPVVTDILLTLDKTMKRIVEAMNNESERKK